MPIVEGKMPIQKMLTGHADLGVTRGKMLIRNC